MSLEYLCVRLSFVTSQLFKAAWGFLLLLNSPEGAMTSGAECRWSDARCRRAIYRMSLLIVHKLFRCGGDCLDVWSGQALLCFCQQIVTKYKWCILNLFLYLLIKMKS